MSNSVYRRYCVTLVVLGILLVSFLSVPLLVFVQSVGALTPGEAVEFCLGHLKWNLDTYADKGNAMGFRGFFPITSGFGEFRLMTLWLC